MKMKLTLSILEYPKNGRKNVSPSYGSIRLTVVETETETNVKWVV